jgi:hypothetical protein
MVSRSHILALVNAGASVAPGGRYAGMSWHWNEVRNEVRYGEDDSAAEVARMLWDENKASVNARYPDTIDHPENMPGTVGENYTITRADFRKPYMHREPVEILKACDCYEYQSCEHAGWPESEAYAFIQALRRKMIRQLPGYEDAPWDIDD